MSASTRPTTPLSHADVRSLVGEIVEERRRDERNAAELEAARHRARSPVVRAAALVIAIASAAGIWLAPPAWMLPARASAPTPQFADASDRLALYLAGQQVEQFRRLHGRLPRTLGEVGRQLTGISYTPGSDASFELASIDRTPVLHYRSGDAAERLLGRTLAYLGMGTR